ncbi:MAG: YdeI/OmpD-associated family protein [Flavobacteriaceae bacterium]|nr:YdeI/OmpD-associated family protein [Flavobacteriaceae bacterium]
MNKIEAYIAKNPEFSELLIAFRKTFLNANLEETVKWGMPTYMYKGKNIGGFAAFKNHCGIWFFQGGLLKDPYKVLVNAQEGKTQAMRQWKFNREDTPDLYIMTEYILEAIENQKKGLKIIPEKKSLVIPDELLDLLNSNERLNESFNAFPPGKKREFADYISAAKRVETKKQRLEKIIPMILNNTGLNDKYRNC